MPPEVRDHIDEFKAGLDSMCEAEFERRCVGQNISNMILWTDERCDFDYYRNKSFDEVAQFPSPVAIDGRRFKTWIFHKNF